MSDILDQIVLKVEEGKLSESDIDSIVVELLSFYTKKISFLARKAYNFSLHEELPQTVVFAFQEQVKEEIKNATYIYLFKYEHWRDNRNFNSYLITCLNRLTTRINNDIESAKKTTVLICPLCQNLNNKEILIIEGNLWRCNECTKLVERLTDELKSVSGISKINLEAKINSHKIFSLHSKKGYRCPDCLRFIPKSANTNYGITCSFDNCGYIGNVKSLTEMVHPVSLLRKNDISIFNSFSSDSSNKDTDLLLNKLEDNILNADVKIDISQTINNEFKVLTQVINDQMALLQSNNNARTFVQKSLMYEAFKITLNTFPEEMISYLVHQKQHNDFPLQAKIFQQYVNLVENYLPFKMKKDNSIIEIAELTDPNLSLFLGKSTFENIVKNNYKIYNNTQERYIGGKLFKDYGPCFIGKLLNIEDIETKESLLPFVKDYNFSEITLTPDVKPGTKVIVSHFRIPSHYELGSLVFLQRIRKHLVDKVYFRLFGKKRIKGGSI